MVIYPYLAKVSLGLSLVFAIAHPAFSQIIPNGAGTLVSPQGNQINITGGTQAGGNLFHSFQDFNVNSGQVANFLSNPQTQNILSRINGGNPSFINGLLQVTGGNSNLFLMNPAGIVFGQGASLNIPASFTATTANQIGFGNNLFNAFGDNNFSALTGTPDSFLFTTNQAGSIVNAGDLAVSSGQSISLLGGNVVNTGNVNAGNITLAAVAGTNRVRISQPGHLLSLEITPSADSLIAPLDLPRLLTGQSLPGIRNDGSTVEVNGVGIPAGQGVNVTAGNLGTFSQGGTINVLGDRVALLGANLEASGVDGGGTIRVGGEYRGGGNNPFNSRNTYVDAGSFLRADALDAGDGGRVIVWGDDTTRFYGNIAARGGANGGNGGFAEVSGAQTLTFVGNADLSAPKGSFGTLLLDPVNILISNGADALGSCALPNITLGCDPGDITISQATLQALGAATNIVLEASNNITLGTLTGGSLDFFTCDAGVCGDIVFTAGGAFNTNGNNINAFGRSLTIEAASITAGNINTSISAISRNGGNINLTATTGNVEAGIIDSASSLATGNSGNGGTVTINAPNGSVIIGEVDSRSVVAGTGNSGNAGNIDITAQAINVDFVNSYSSSNVFGNSGNGGSINLVASGNIAATDVNSTSGTFQGTSATGGNIILNSTNGSINIGNEVISDSISRQIGNSGNGGTIDLLARGNIVTPFLVSSTSGARQGTSATGGNITINSTNGSIEAGTVVSNSGTTFLPQTGNAGNAGNINLFASSNITATVVQSASRTLQGTSATGGNISINSTNGSINTGLVESVSGDSLQIGNSGNGGIIDLLASGDITATTVQSTSGTFQGTSATGGNIMINSTSGSINAGDVFSFSGGSFQLGNAGNGGTINLLANGNIAANLAYSYSQTAQGTSARGGDITINSTSGSINTGNVSSFSRGGLIGNSGNGGTINLLASGNIIAATIQSLSSTRQGTSATGGDIMINSTSGSINTDAVDSFSGGTLQDGNSGNGGNIDLVASGNITTATIQSLSQTPQGTSATGGDIMINSTSGSINTGSVFSISGGNLQVGNSGNGGNINLLASGNIATTSVSSSSTARQGNSGDGGTITINSSNGSATANTIYTFSGTSNGSNVGSGGNIFINLPNGNLSVSGGNTNEGSIGSDSRYALNNSVTNSGSGGVININTGGTLFAANRIGSSSRFGNGGSISLSSGSDISLDFVSTTSFGGVGGSLTIVTPTLFSATGSYTNFQGTLASISTAGANGGGAITITHGGSTTTPFIVGSPSINGTVAAITSGLGANTINNLTVPVPPDINNYGTNISIRTTAPTPTPLPTPSISLSPLPSPGLVSLLTNPAPPQTPAPVVVGTPPASSVPSSQASSQAPAPVVVSTPSASSNQTSQTTPNSIAISPPLATSQPSLIEVITPPVLSIPNIPSNLIANFDATSPGVQASLTATSANLNIPIIDRIPTNFLGNSLRLLDDPFKEEFQLFSGISDEIATLDVNQAQDILQRIIRETNTKPVFIYVFFAPENEVERTVNSARGLSSALRVPQDTDILEVVLVPPTGDLVRVKYPGLKRPQVIETAQRFVSLTISQSNGYIGSARQLHEWIIAPLIQEELKKREINNLVFLMDVGLRSIPLAAMRDKQNGDRFIIEDYSVGLMPSLTLTDTSYTPLRGSEVLGMGAASFVSEDPLPAVPLELNAINQLWGGNTLINENFTLNNLRQARRPGQRIVHLATHGIFASGEKSNSYIQLWGNERLTLDQIRQAGWGDPPIDLLVLSACETALGDREAELGFAGLAVQAGVKSAMASLWRVSDEGTLGLMTEFYKQLQETTTKSEALRLAQLAMLRGEVRLEGGNLVTPQGIFPLNEELRRSGHGDRSFQHPYFWSGFTMVGNPW
jgi:filamentous hemagglutinin family protein